MLLTGTLNYIEPLPNEGEQGLFGPSMSKPFKNQRGEIIFYVVGGNLATQKTEIWEYKEKLDGQPTWQ